MAPAQPLAIDPLLTQAALGHSQDMSNRAYFDHNTPDGVDPGQRLTAVGVNWASWGESIGAGTAYPNSASVLEALIIDSGIPDLAHRKHLLAIDPLFQTQNEVGVGIVQGGTGPLVNYYTIDTAATNDGRPFLTGVVFQDNEGTGHYDAGEGAANVLITVTNGTTTRTLSTFDSGGYALQLDPGTYTVTASGGGLVSPVTQTVTIGTTNVRLNFVLPGGAVQPQATAWVGMLYRDLLGRVPGASEVAGWANSLVQGASRAGIVDGFLHSAEYSQRLVSGWYASFLHRAADSGGLAGFSTALQGGLGADAEVASILASPEYFAQHGGSPGGFVAGLYQDLLGRTPQGNEANTWIMLAAVGNRARVVNGIMHSQEFDSDQVANLYTSYLRRDPDADGMNHFVNFLGQQGTDKLQVVRGILASQEYYQNAQDVLWLRGLYNDILGRNGDNAAELGSWLANLLQFGNRQGVAHGFLVSQEEAAHVVTGLYQQLLNRGPDAVGMQMFTSRLQSTGHANDVIVQLAGSDEYYALRSSNNSMFVRGLYHDLLQRGASDAEVLAWLNKLDQGETRGQVVADFLATQQYQDAYITGLFNFYLHRAPGNLELSQFESQMQSGNSDAAIVTALVASNEYFLAPTS